MSLILLRHSKPVGADGLCYGRTDLLPDDSFDAQIARLRTELPPVCRILSSPLTRCRMMAEALGTHLDLAPILDPRLVEMDFGAWEGLAWDAIPRAELDAWAADFLHARPHGGESVAQLGARTAAALTEAAQGETPALVVAHAGIIKAALVAAGDPKGWHVETGFAQWRAVTL